LFTDALFFTLIFIWYTIIFITHYQIVVFKNNIATINTFDKSRHQINKNLSMSRIPNSWHWKELKLTIIFFLCSLSILFFFLFNFYLALVIFFLWSIFVIKNAYFTPIHLNILYARFFFEYLLEKPDLLSQLRPLYVYLF